MLVDIKPPLGMTCLKFVTKLLKEKRKLRIAALTDLFMKRKVPFCMKNQLANMKTQADIQIIASENCT
jgi:hypothetical protein